MFLKSIANIFQPREVKVVRERQERWVLVFKSSGIISLLDYKITRYGYRTCNQIGKISSKSTRLSSAIGEAVKRFKEKEGFQKFRPPYH